MDQMTKVPATLGRPPFDLAAEFSRFRQNWPAKLHFAAHSHHFWPDATREAHLRAWDDAARLVDGKWQEVLGPVWQKVAQGVAKHLNLPGIDGLVPANNTHEFVNRLISCLPRERKPRILTSDAEFHSFRRQIERLAEDGLIELTVVPAEPFEGLTERLIAAAKQSPGPDMVFVSQVHFNSGYALTDLETLVDGVSAPERLVVIDGYHGFLARPTDLSRAFLPTSEWALEPGMVFHMYTRGRGIGISETVHIAPGGAERLTRLERDLLTR